MGKKQQNTSDSKNNIDDVLLLCFSFMKDFTEQTGKNFMLLVYRLGSLMTHDTIPTILENFTAAVRGI